MRNTPDQIFDALLVMNYKEGDDKALTLLVNRWQSKLLRQANWYLNDVDTSKDIVQDSWSVIIKKIGTLKDPNRFGSWVKTIVSRKCIDRIKKNKQHLKSDLVLNEEMVAIQENSYGQQVNSVLKAIRELSVNHQLILNLFYVESKSLKEISGLLKISEGTVKSRLFHARTKLKSILKNKYHEE